MTHGRTDTSRRRLLVGLGGLGVAGLRTVGGPATATTVSAESRVSSAPDDPFADADELEEFVETRIRRRLGDVTPGASVAVVKGDTPVLAEGYGTANTLTGTPVRADETAFRVGSVGKLVTWTAVVQGVERGVLDLDADVNTYLEDSAVTIPETYDEPVTLRHLGTHTAGFQSGLDPGVVADPDALDPLEELLADRRPPRERPPGELVEYSNYGAALAGHVVAEAHDMTFERYVRSELFEPLGMTHSTFAQPVPDDFSGDLASGHTDEGTSFTPADEVFINMRPAGSTSATATDMAAFMSAHLGGGAVGDARILAEESVRTMHDRHHVRHPAVTNWRYGFHEHGDPDANLVAHSGATVDFTSYLLLAPDHDVGIFVAYNVNGTEAPEVVVDELVAEFGLQPSPTPPIPTATPGGHERAATVAGEYGATYFPETGPLQAVGLLAHLSVESAGEGRLRTETAGGEPRHWVETEPYVYREVGSHDVLAFEVRDDEVRALNVSSEPTGVYRPVPVRARQLTTAGVVGGSAAGFGASLLGWGGLGAWRRLKRCDDSSERTTEESR
ncbi:serine hydrolase domain-containing protein [Halorussus salinus]|uniref:serine hydrolase domain-containing protein n=1 Tax=Halorussus salinus TaxID=1364935 RepID=UPI0010923655|nr:serine hydrolase domain-containing protein [Halorussus salinus]